MAEHADGDAHGAPLGSDAVRFERLLPGPIERVWSFLVAPERLATWLAGGVLEPRVGGRVELVFRHAELSRDRAPPPPRYATYEEGHVLRGTVTVWAPPRRLAYTWAEGSGRSSEVTFELEPVGESVRLVLTHRRLDGRDARVSVASGWHAHLSILRDRLEGREPPAFWRLHGAREAEYQRRLPGGSDGAAE